ncbi:MULTISPECIES: hypothetical protein [unclassified Ensifer]|uniref:hypothetical protein n=1 Tax=unclassified Ensifer TaxID=2633371 RepID=UPI001FCCE951|nr:MULTISPECIES: hypothetical protein [unclassified Ensifer]
MRVSVMPAAAIIWQAKARRIIVSSADEKDVAIMGAPAMQRDYRLCDSKTITIDT